MMVELVTNQRFTYFDCRGALGDDRFLGSGWKLMRILVHAEWRPEIDPDVSEEQRDEQWAEMVVPLFERAIALGGRTIGWSARTITVDFSWDGLYDAIDFLVDAPLAPDLAAGISHGQLKVVYDGARIAFALGAPLRVARNLANLARPGEVLLSPSLVEDSQGRLGTLGEVGKRPGRPEVPGILLDPEHPLKETKKPDAPTREEVIEMMPAERSSHPPSSRAPESERVRQMDRFVSTTAALGDTAPAVFPEEVSKALRKRDAESLHRLAESIRSHAAPEAAERLDAMAQLADGKSGEALRRLRRSKENAPQDDPSARCRAALALGVALATAGRPYEAALEALDGLARAREGKDERGERACARFLSQLSLTFRDQYSSEAWGLLGS
jgi:class 3 adenylate cyclase